VRVETHEERQLLGLLSVVPEPALYFVVVQVIYLANVLIRDSVHCYDLLRPNGSMVAECQMVTLDSYKWAPAADKMSVVVVSGKNHIGVRHTSRYEHDGFR
jgi:hypothetical protein